MSVTLDKKPQKRLVQDVQDLRAQFNRCSNRNERLAFLNTDGKFLQEHAPTTYRELAEACLADVDETCDRALLGRVLYRHATTCHRMRDREHAEAGLRAAEQIADELDEHVLAVAISGFRARILVYSGNAVQGLPHVEQVRKRLDRLPVLRDRYEFDMSSSMIAATGRLMTGQLVEALREIRRFVEIGRLRGTKRSAYSIHFQLAYVLKHCEQFAEAERLLHTHLALERTRKTTHNIASALLTIVKFRCESGGADESCRALLQEARELAETVPQAPPNALIDLAESMYLLHLGRPHDALRFITRACENIDETEQPEPCCEIYNAAAQTHLDLQQPDEAEDYITRSLAIARRQQYLPMEVAALNKLTAICEKRGEWKRAQEVRSQHKKRHAELTGQQHDPEFIEHRNFIQSELARQQLMLELAKSNQLQQATREAERERRQIEQHLVSKALIIGNKNNLLYAVKTLVETHLNNIDEAVQSDFAELQRSISVHLDEEDLWREFDEQFALVHPGFQENLRKRHPRLTPTERKVCALMKLELPSKDVCRILRIGQRSVETHRYNIRKKMGLSGTVSFADALADIS